MLLVSKPTSNIFLSYDHKTGLEYARKAKRVFSEAGYRVWMWEDDHKPTGYPREDIVDNIEACDVFLCICTQGTDTSEGQRFEINYPPTWTKQLLILTFDCTYVPKVLKSDIWNPVTPRNFEEDCRRLAHDLDNYARLTKAAGFDGEGEPFEPT